MPLPVIEPLLTDRLRVRPVTEDDLPALAAVNGDDEVTRYLPYASWRSADDGRAWLERMRALEAAGGARQLVVARRDDDIAIGSMLLFRHDEPSARVELGYVLGREHWRQGIAREALAAVLRHVFGRLGLRRVEAEVHVGNVASQALLERLGFRREGLLRQRWVAKGHAYDVVAFGLLSSDGAG